MDPRTLIHVEVYVTARGEAPFEQWISRLKDRVARAKVRVQIDRVTLGNLGKCRFLKGAMGELRVAWGPGYRVYFGWMETGRRILLLWGGDKSSQPADIRRALEYWADFRSRHHGHPT